MLKVGDINILQTMLSKRVFEFEDAIKEKPSVEEVKGFEEYILRLEEIFDKLESMKN